MIKHMRTNVRTAGMVVGILGSASCTTGTDESCDICTEYCDICTLSTDVRGSVRDEADIPILGATVDLKPLYFAECERAADDDDSVSAVTNESGAFAMIVGAISILAPHCVQVHITPPDTRQLLSLIDTITAQFALPGEVPPVQHVTFILRAPAG